MPKTSAGVPTFINDLRNELRARLVAAFGQAVDMALNEVLGGAPAASNTSPAPKARRGRPAGVKGKPRAAARQLALTYNATSPKARRLPGFMLTLLGGNVEKKVLARRYGDFTFTPETTKAESEAQAKKMADARPLAGEVKAGALKIRKAHPGKKAKGEPAETAEV